jgi:hypothetical protein
VEYKHLIYCPFTGLGLYGGFRGNRWLRNRIQIFKQFVIPSLKAQTNKDFTLWISWRPEEKNNPYVKDFMYYLKWLKEFETVHTFHGVCFWDDKYPDDVARDRLLTNLHNTMGEMTDVISECDYVLMTIQPSDDLYHREVVEAIQEAFKRYSTVQATGFAEGYIINYQTKEVAEYNPKTNPPFFTIKFPRATFIDPLMHAEYTGPYKSHEYVGDKLEYCKIKKQIRGFMVGTHGENISTTWQIPYKGERVSDEVLKDFGIDGTERLKIKVSMSKKLYLLLPHRVQRKLRYWWGERVYNWIRT